MNRAERLFIAIALPLTLIAFIISFVYWRVESFVWQPSGIEPSEECSEVLAPFFQLGRIYKTEIPPGVSSREEISEFLASYLPDQLSVRCLEELLIYVGSENHRLIFDQHYSIRVSKFLTQRALFFVIGYNVGISVDEEGNVSGPFIAFSSD